jgi:hypothetical protein
VCGKHISAAVDQHATTEVAVFSVGAVPRLYNEDLTEEELELSRVSGVLQLAELRRNGKKGIRLCKDFMCDLKLQRDCYKYVCQETASGECVRLRALVFITVNCEVWKLP